jgi:hypothetical protein
MPSVREQMAMPASRTNPERTAARFLLKPGRKYEDAVKAFQPYDSTKEINDDARKAAASLIEEVKQNPKGKTSIYVNSRFYTARGIKPIIDENEGLAVHRLFPFRNKGGARLAGLVVDFPRLVVGLK